MAFHLDPTLERDSFALLDFDLCSIRLMDNKCFPWLLLIPQREDLREWIDLSREEQHLLSDEIAIVSHIFQALVTPDKLNIATIGNKVEQLHVHVVGRYRGDVSWPDPVWGGPREYYEKAEADKFCYELRNALGSVRG